MASDYSAKLSRRSILGAFAAVPVISAAPYYANAAGHIRGAGDVRRIRLSNSRTTESIDAVYWIEGEYLEPVLKEISFFMRDWRRNAIMDYDRNNIDIIAATHRLLDVDEPFQLLSGYRTAATNAMLKSRGYGVASNSYHMKAMAADLRLRNRSTAQMSSAAIACSSGGVGRYRRSNFIHIDSGPIRQWNG